MELSEFSNEKDSNILINKLDNILKDQTDYITKKLFRKYLLQNFGKFCLINK
jgi:hypothetical protein